MIRKAIKKAQFCFLNIFIVSDFINFKSALNLLSTIPLISSLHFIFPHLIVWKLLAKADFGHFGNVQIFVSNRSYLCSPMRSSVKIFKLQSRKPEDYI